MRIKGKHILLSGVLMVLLLPLLQQLKPFLHLAPLNGVSNVAVKPELNRDLYWDGKYQEGMNAWLNEQFGFRPALVRIINQLRYSLFSVSTVPGVVLGKNKELYMESYIDEYTGKNYKGLAALKDIVSKTKRVQDSLWKTGIDLVVVFAPGKASFSPGNIPDHYLKCKQDSTNYAIYVKLFNDAGVHFIDLNAYFRKIKGKTIYPLFPKNGAHWNHYAMCIGLDTLLKRIEKVHNIDVPDFDYSQVTLNNSAKGNDYDIGILMNLKKDIPKEVMPYPNYVINEINKEKPDVLVVGDSYWWCLVGDNLPGRFFAKDEYWFYNKDIILNNSKKENKVRYVNLFEQVRKRKTIVLISTEATYYMFPYGFIERLEKMLCVDNKRVWELANARIRPDSAWYAGIVRKAQEAGISAEQQLYLDAKYVLLEEIGNTEEPRNEVIKTIKADPAWFSQIEQKARDEKRSLEEQLILDADYMVKEERKAIYGDVSTDTEAQKVSEELESIINRIRSDEKWLKYVKEKATLEKRGLEEQLKIEAAFIQANP